MHTRKLRHIAVSIALIVSAGGAWAQQALIESLREGGFVILIRHTATEPGLGDPPGFALDDCSTQRNLSQTGREQAHQLGDWFVRHEIPVGQVRTSQWCRCLDTAALAFGERHEVTPWSPINSFFEDRGTQAAASRAALADLDTPVTGNRVWVTHQVNITALTGVFPAMGEMVIARPAPDGDALRLTAVGRIKSY